MKHINLYQAAFHPPRTILPARTLLAGGALFLAALLALYAWDAWRLTQLRREVGQLTAQASRLDARVQAGNVTHQADPRVLAEADAVETRLRNLQLAQQAVAGGALGSATGYAAQFRALGRARVAGAWVTGVEIGEGGRALNLRGRTLTGEDGARLIASLRREPLFVGLSFAGLTLTPPVDSAKPDAAGDGRKGPPRFLEFTLSARQVAPAQPGVTATTAPTAAKPDLAALAAAYAAQSGGKVDVNQPMQAAAGGNAK